MKTIIPATSFPVSLSEAKHQLGFFHSEDDAAVQALIALATEEAEEYTGLATHFTTVEERLEQFPAGMIVLTGLPYGKVNSIKYYDADGNLQTLSSSAYRVYQHNAHIQIEIIDSWPSTYTRLDAVTVEYVIGYAATASAAADTDVITVTGHPFSNGNRLTVYKATDGSLPTGLTERRIYYVVNASTNTLQLSETEGGTAIDLTTDGTGTWYIGFSEVPRVIKQAILMTLAGCNEYRTDEITGTIISKVMMSSRYLLDHAKPKRL